MLLCKMFSLSPSFTYTHTQPQYHRDCIDAVLQKYNSCPLDGYVIYNYNALTWATAGGKNIPKLAFCSSYDHTKLTEKNRSDLSIPGVLLLGKTTAPSNGTLSLEVPTGPLTLATVPRDHVLAAYEAFASTQ